MRKMDETSNVSTISLILASNPQIISQLDRQATKILVVKHDSNSNQLVVQQNHEIEKRFISDNSHVFTAALDQSSPDTRQLASAQLGSLVGGDVLVSSKINHVISENVTVNPQTSIYTRSNTGLASNNPIETMLHQNIETLVPENTVIQPNMNIVVPPPQNESMVESKVQTRHDGDRRFSCNMCNKSYSHKGALNLHMKYHSGKGLYRYG